MHEKRASWMFYSHYSESDVIEIVSKNEEKPLRLQISVAQNPAALQNCKTIVVFLNSLTFNVTIETLFCLYEMLLNPSVCHYLWELVSAIRWTEESTAQQMVLTAVLGSIRRCCRTLASSQRPDEHRRSNSHSSLPSTLASAHTPPTAPRDAHRDTHQC